MRIKAWVEISGGNTTTLVIPDEDLEDLSPQGRDEAIFAYVNAWVDGSVSSGYDVIEEARQTPKKRGKKTP